MSVIRPSDLHGQQLPGRTSADALAGVESQSSVRVVRLHPTDRRTAHRHPHSEEVILVTEGSGTVWIDGERMAVGPGDLVHVPAGAAHATVPNPGAEMTLTCFFPHPNLEANIEETDIDVTEEAP